MASDEDGSKKPAGQFMVPLSRMSRPADAQRDGFIEALVRKPLVGVAQKAREREISNFKAQQASGAGFVADEILRYFQRDYQNRLQDMGMEGMPTNYRIGGSFFNRAGAPRAFMLFPERDYLVSFSDFLDFVTDASSPKVDLGLGYALTENVIYSINATDDVGGLLLSTNSSSAYGFRAASMLRQADELVLMLSVAEQPSQAVLAGLEERAAAELAPLRPGKEGIARRAKERLRDFGESRVVRIEGTDLLPTTAMVRFDLKHRVLAGRCLLRDQGDRFDTRTDVLAVFEGEIDAENPGFVSMVAELDDAEALWELAKTMLLLPAYLDARVTLIKDEPRETRFSKLPSVARKALAAAEESQRVRFRTISAVRIERAASLESISGRTFTPPQFQIPVDGFWRMLADPEQTGKDAAGEPVKGRTWVRAHLRFKDRPASPDVKTVYVKASLSVARQRVDAYRRRMAKRNDIPRPASVDSVLPAGSGAPQSVGEGRHGAFVYVMRCHAHADNLFKVGFTDRDPEVRAKELSSSTSAPSPFEVVRAWAVSEGLRAEQAAHEALRAVRYSANREFFSTAYVDLQVLLEAAIKPWLLAG